MTVALLDTPATAPTAAEPTRLGVLDGWRAISILLVLAGHLLPLGPAAWGLNNAVAAMGMVIFFTLSGFLITRFLAKGTDLRVFIIHRVFRVVPLAWLVMVIVLIANRSSLETWLANLLFYANLPPFFLVTGGGHLWSLCLAVTTLRIVDQQYLNIVTWYRVDEILAGGILALVHTGWYGTRPQHVLARLNPYWILPLLLLSAHPAGGVLNYARPYLAAALVGSTLLSGPDRLCRALESHQARYVAKILYALYIFHAALMESWLGSGSKTVKYAKRPVLLAAIFGLAHVSTFRFEQPCIDFAKRLTRGFSVKAPV